MQEQLSHQSRLRLKDDFPFYAEHCLKIRPKEGQIAPFVLNRAQLYLHQKAEEQLARTGKVRIVVLKGRQQGISTYIQGRFYHKVSHTPGVRSFILTHDSEATKNLFEMTERLHLNCPDPVRPMLGASNSKELEFDALDSGYKIGTAGNDEVGRGSTIQYFHASEVAFWANASKHAKGIMQAIPSGFRARGTEVFVESTANGKDNYFYDMWTQAEKEDGEFIAVFIPWFWETGYRDEWRSEWEVNDYEKRLQEQYELDLEQLAWRRLKCIELHVDGNIGEEAFKQEYPCNPEEAFTASVGGEFKAEWIEYYDHKGFNAKECNIYILVDGANKVADTSDYTAIVVIGLAPDNNYYLLDMIRDKLNPKQRPERVIEMHKKWNKLGGKPPRVGCEQYGTMTDAFYLKESQKSLNYRFHVIELGGKIKKEDRIRQLIPLFENRRFYLLPNLLYTDFTGKLRDLVSDFIDQEFTAFPDVKHDDVLDAISRICDPQLGAAFPAPKVSTTVMVQDSGYDPLKQQDSWLDY